MLTGEQAATFGHRMAFESKAPGKSYFVQSVE